MATVPADHDEMLSRLRQVNDDRAHRETMQSELRKMA
jgi:hypothetical protein